VLFPRRRRRRLRRRTSLPLLCRLRPLPKLLLIILCRLPLFLCRLLLILLLMPLLLLLTTSSEKCDVCLRL